MGPQKNQTQRSNYTTTYYCWRQLSCEVEWSESHSIVSNSLRPHGLTRGIFQARILQWVAFPFSRGSSQPGIEHRSPTLQVDSLPAEPQGKPKNTGVGSITLLQRIFLTQELNWGLLHCRRLWYNSLELVNVYSAVFFGKWICCAVLCCCSIVPSSLWPHGL